MAYGVKWFSEFDDIQENVIYRVEVQERDYSGGSIEVKSGGNPLIIEMNSSENVYTTIREQKVSVEWVADEESGFQISDLFITDDKKYRLQVFEYVSGSPVVRWSGFVVPIDCEEPFASKPYLVNFTATCGLPFLSDDYYLDSAGGFIEGRKSLINLIAHCLQSTGLELNIDTYIDLYEQGMSTSSSPLAQAEIDSDGLRGKKAWSVLEGILAPFGAFITQSNNKWVIKGIREQNNSTAQRYTFSPSGTLVSSGSDMQMLSIGRTGWTSDTPNVRPTSEVVEKLAEPNSIVTEKINPGIPVNRLFNGTFSGPVLGGNIPGWNNRTGGRVSWARAGSGKPDDPYRLEYYNEIRWDERKKKNIYQPYSYFDTGPIELNLGAFDISEEQRAETKIRVTGAVRMHNSIRFAMQVTLNEQEREYASFLKTDAEWFYSKKEDAEIRVNTTQKEYEEPVKGYNELKTQTFDIESKRITNYLKINGQAVVRIRVRVFPSIQWLWHSPTPSFMSIEDLSITVVEGTVYEGDHAYQADGGLAIRNANEVEYTSIIADKTGIDTPEQSRPVNRVMTGYMTLAGSNTLTQGWKYSTDSGYEPIQSRSLRDRIRQLCGKRRVIEGSFVGYELTPDKTLFNRYDESGTPSTFYTQTSWRWDVKNAVFDTALNELDFTPLSFEDIYLYDEESGARGNRMYRNVSSSATSGVVKYAEPIEMDASPVVYFTVGVQEIKVVDLAALIISAHKPISLDVSAIHYTDWVSHVGIDRGEKGFDLNVLITAKPKEAGTDRVQIYLTTSDGDKVIFIIHLVAVPQTKITYQLRDTTSNTILGKITQGAGFMKPDSWRIEAVIAGFHEGYYASVVGPGVSSTVTPYPYLAVDGNDSATYFLPTSGSYIGEVGTYNLDFATFRNEGDPELYAQVKRDQIAFILYDEEYLNKVKFELWVGGSKFGDINPDGSSAFNTEGQAFNVKIIVEGLPHDLATAILTSKGVDYKTHVYTADPAIEDAEYDLYESTPSPQPEGLYELNFNTSDEVTETVYDRLVAFTINKKKPVPQGGSLQLVSMVSNTTNYNVMGTLSLNGNLFSLPTTGWNVLLSGDVAAGTTRTVELFQKKGSSLIDTNITLYTKRPQTTEYSEEVEDEEFLIFDTLSSKDIDKIHLNNTSFRVRITDELDGEQTIYSGDFSFGVLEDIDDLPIEEPGNGGEGIQEYYAGEGLSEIVDDYIKTFNVNTDDVTIEIYDPTNLAVNWLRIKDKGVTFAKMQDIPTLSLIGKLTAGTGTPYAVTVLDGASAVAASDATIGTTLWVKNQLGTTVTGTIGRIPKFITVNSLGDSIARELTGTFYIDGFFVAGATTNERIRIASDASNGYVNFTDSALATRFALRSQATKLGFEVAGTEAFRINQSTVDVTFIKAITIGGAPAPLNVTSQLLCVNLNADLLDGQHGPYYLDRANHTGTQLASTISNFSTAVLATTLTGLSIVTGSAITSSDTILSAFGKLQGQVNTNTSNVSGTAGQLAYFNTASSISSSIAKQASGTLTVEGFQVVGASANEKVRIAMDTANSYVQFSDPSLVSRFALHSQATKLGFEVAGTEAFRINQSTVDVTFVKAITISTTTTSPLVVSSTILVTNFNADLLDGQHGPYYLDRANHTGVQAISTVTGLQTALDSKPTGNGVNNRFVVWTGTNTVASSNLFYNGGNVGVGMVPGYQFDVSGSIRYSNQLASTVATGTAPLDVTSTTLCVNLNADLLDGQHGSYYLDWNNFTNVPLGSLVQGSNVTLTGTLTNRLIGTGNVTISATSMPWPNITSKPTTISGFGITDAPTFSDLSSGLSGKENTFSKGNLIQGSNVTLSGTLTNRLVGSGDVTVSVTSIPWSIITGKPTTLSGYGITDAYTKAQVDAMITSSPVTVVGQTSNRVVRYLNGTSPAQLSDGYIDDDGSIISFLNPARLLNLTYSQRVALGSSVPVGTVVYQTTASGSAGIGIYSYAGSGFWLGHLADYVGA